MPLAEDALTSARPRSPRLVRGLLLGALGAGLLSLGLPIGASPAVQAVSATSVARSTALVEPAAPHAPRFTAPRASRTRPHPARKAVVRKKKAVSGWVRPSYAAVVSPYGPRWGGFHKGVDFGAGYAAPIRAAGAGVVVGSGYLSGESGYGLITLIRHSNGYVTAYAHQSTSFVHVGEQVDAGETIGLVGSTGHSTGPHLHFEVRTQTHGGQINPLPWLREHGVSI